MTKRHKIRFDILVCRKISDFVTLTTTAENGAPYLIKTNHKKEENDLNFWFLVFDFVRKKVTKAAGMRM